MAKGNIGNKNISVVGGGKIAAPKEETNYKNQTEAEWEANNQKLSEDFDNWIDSNDKKAFEADEYNVFEKLSLNEVRRYLTPDSEDSSKAYYGYDEIPQDEAWSILYKDGSVVTLSEGDSLTGVKRGNIQAAINYNANTTMIYGKSSNLEFYNTSDYKDNNDIYMVDFYYRK